MKGFYLFLTVLFGSSTGDIDVDARRAGHINHGESDLHKRQAGVHQDGQRPGVHL